jgi:hypothetical protein
MPPPEEIMKDNDANMDGKITREEAANDPTGEPSTCLIRKATASSPWKNSRTPNRPAEPLVMSRGAIMTTAQSGKWRNTILAGLANYIDAGSIVAGPQR